MCNSALEETDRRCDAHEKLGSTAPSIVKPAGGVQARRACMSSCHDAMQLAGDVMRSK